MIIDQREIQRIGGAAAKFPSAYVVNMLLRKIRAEKVLDVTYGRGRFYYIYRPRLLIGADPVKRDWVVNPDRFYQANVWQLYSLLEERDFDVVVCDPPKWNRRIKYNKREEYDYVIGDAYSIIMGAIRLAREKTSAKYFLLHYNKLLPLQIIEDVKFVWWARYLYSSNKNPTHFTLYLITPSQGDDMRAKREVEGE